MLYESIVYDESSDHLTSHPQIHRPNRRQSCCKRWKINKGQCISISPRKHIWLFLDMLFLQPQDINSTKISGIDSVRTLITTLSFMVQQSGLGIFGCSYKGFLYYCCRIVDTLQVTKQYITLFAAVVASGHYFLELQNLKYLAISRWMLWLCPEERRVESEPWCICFSSQTIKYIDEFGVFSHH